MKHRFIAFVSVFVISLGALAGCGGSGSQKAERGARVPLPVSHTKSQSTTEPLSLELVTSGVKPPEESTGVPGVETNDAVDSEQILGQPGPRRDGTVTISHPFGTVSYPINPQRVVAIGQVAVDNLLALGVRPIMIMGTARERHIPWQEEIMGHDVPFVEVTDFMDPNAELIAKYKPDLIVGDVWRITAPTYKKLSKVAPTIGPASYDPAKIGWKEQTKNLAAIFDEPSKADEIIAQDRARFARARREMPGLKGKTGIASQYIGSMNSFGVIAQPMIPANQFFTDLGMKIPEKIVNAPNQQAGRATISNENIDWLNADFALWGPRDATVDDVRKVPGFSNLRQVKTGAYRITPHPYLLQAINQPSALSRAYALRELRPELQIAARS